ncbi:hypothetical protein AVEN_74068-1 [Araneus ventricosus]|uniref:Uncharacterized protein n=1 Tax=Araneus ventricosus TaxID=182803 RepID=A0A4Y2PHX0_ARAVE|nr:hypothetical protein AVEN_74068-1 [Araneus ventricosus]
MILEPTSLPRFPRHTNGRTFDCRRQTQRRLAYSFVLWWIRALNCPVLKRIIFFMQGRGGLVVRPRLWGRRIPGSIPDSTEDPPCMGPVAR